jgi:hypothetical protein
MTVYLVISLPKKPYIHRIYMVLANPTYMVYKRHVRMVFMAGEVTNLFSHTVYIEPLMVAYG